MNEHLALGIIIAVSWATWLVWYAIANGGTW